MFVCTLLAVKHLPADADCRRETDALEEQRAATSHCREECTSVEKKLHQVEASLQPKLQMSWHAGPYVSQCPELYISPSGGTTGSGRT